ncbi:MAG: MFS transporter [Chloroflexi bacterium]|nr:MFS transporter [Chloroflexota bacterium]
MAQGPLPTSTGAGSVIAALRHREFQLLFGGLVASNVGNWMQQFALGWLIVLLAARDGHPELAPFYLGLRSLASAGPSLLAGLFAGVIADRTDRRDLLIWSRVVSAVLAAALAGLVIVDQINIWLVLALSAASAGAFAFDMPGRQAMLPDIVPSRDLFSAMGLTRASMQAAHTTGPLIAGLLLVPIGIGGVLMTKAVLFIASVFMMLPMAQRPPPPEATAGTMLDSLKEGLRYIAGEPVLRWMSSLLVIFALFGFSFQQLLPALAVDTLRVGALELSWMVAAHGAGALVGAFFTTIIGGVRARGPLFLSAMLVSGLLVIVLALQTTVWPVLIVLAVVGAVQQVYMGVQSVTLQLMTPGRLRGRVMGTQSMTFMVAGPIGVMILGTLATVIGMSSALLLGGAATVAAACVATFRAGCLRGLRGGEEADRAALGVSSPEESPAD